MAAARNRSRRATAEAPDQRGADAARWAARCEASDAAPYAERLAALYAAVADTILILERAQPPPGRPRARPERVGGVPLHRG